MFRIFGKNHFSALLAILSLNIINPGLMAQSYYSPMAQDCCDSPWGGDCGNPCESNRFYIGGFGGGLYSNSTSITQTGTAFFLEEVGGPLAVDARGRSGSTSSGFGGVQIGYEWTQSPFYLGCSSWSLSPGVEAEAFFYSHTKKGDLINPTDRLPEHDFLDSFPMDMQAYLINGVLSLNSCYLGKFSPYVGGGIGPARISIEGADSLQVAPPELGINHFNSDGSDTAWAFAAQVKAGLRYNIFNGIHLFGEYRFLYVDASRYVFGSTEAVGHVPTSTWIVDIKNITYNGFAFGIQFDL